MLSTSDHPQRPAEQATEAKILFTIDADFDAPSVSKPHPGSDRLRDPLPPRAPCLCLYLCPRGGETIPFQPLEG